MPVEVLDNAIKLDLDYKKFRNKNKIAGIDSTASPGNKTLQLAQLCDKVFAFERDAKRIKVLNDRIGKAHSENVTTLNSDFLLPETKPETKEGQQIKLIVCDPSCSGSGMNLHIDQDKKKTCTLEQSVPDDELERVKNLSKFQYKLLNHALQYDPNVKYVSYSTCSIWKQEDEDLIKDVLSKNQGWKVAPNL